MGGAAPDMSYRKRLRSHNSDVIQIHSDDDEEGNEMRDGVSEVKNRKTSSNAAFLEKGRQKKGGTSRNKNMMTDDREKEEKTVMWNGHKWVKSKTKVSTASLEKMNKEKLCNANKKKKMQICDDNEGTNRCNWGHKLKNGKESTKLSEQKKKNKEMMNKTQKEKMCAADSKGRKILRDHNRVQKSGKVPTASFGKLQSEEEEEEEEEEVWNCGSKVKNKEKMNKTHKEKMRAADSKEKKILSGHNRVKKSGEVSAAFFGKLQSDEEEEEVWNCGSKVKNKEKMNKTHKEEMWAADSNERKVLSGHNRVKKSGEVSTAFFGKLQSDEEEEEEVWNCSSKVKNRNVSTTFSKGDKSKKRSKYTSTEKETTPLTPAVKDKRMSPSESTEMMMLYDKPNGRNVPSNVSKDKMLDASSGSNYKKRKREEPHSLSNQEKRVWCNASDKKIQSGEVKEKKIRASNKEKNKQAPFAFFKFIYNYFEEFLLIPPAVAPKLEDLTNLYLHLEDSEKTHSKVRLSVMNGSLAFHEGWDIFVSDHSIKLGEFLLFERIATKIISVRIFGIDSRERLSFKKDPKRVEYGLGSGPSQQDNINGNLISRQCKTKDASPPRIKKKTVILISDSGTSAHNEDILNLATTDADSAPHVTINTNKDPKRVQSGVGNLPDGGCGTKCISPCCSEVKTSSEIIVADEALLTHENDGRVGYELEVLDLDEDLIRKQGVNSIPLDSITAVEKHQNHSETNVSQNFYRKYEAPGGFRCLEKWRKGTVNSVAALDGNVLIEPENTGKTGIKLVHGYGSIGLNTGNECFCSERDLTCIVPVFTMPVKEPSTADRVSKYRHGGTEIDHSINEKSGGASVQIETQGEQLEPMGSIVNSQRNNILVPANTVVLGKYGALGLNPAGPEGTCAFVESMFTVPVEKPLSPDGISKCGSSRTEIDHNVNGKGTIVQLETKMDHVFPVGSSVCSQSSNIATYANHVIAHVSEHHFSKQEGRNSINCEIPESSLPMKDKILELGDHSLLKFSLELCVPDTTRKWLALSKLLPHAVKWKRHGCSVILLKDPMKRLWPVLYQETLVFVGFTAGWKHFVAANNLEAGDLCDLVKEPDDGERVYSVLITRQGL